jgi:hypothetical protein
MNAAKMRRYANMHGMQCISQEIVPWSTKRIQIDCFSTIVKENSTRSRETCYIHRNPDFMKEAKYLSNLSRLYGSTPPKA